MMKTQHCSSDQLLPKEVLSLERNPEGWKRLPVLKVLLNS